MFLSQMLLNTRSRQVWREHRTLYETHRTIMSAFPEDLPPDERVLFRREDLRDAPSIRLLVQSIFEPDWSVFGDRPAGYFLSAPETKQVDLAFAPGQVLVFRLQANPTVKRGGKRLGLFREEDQLAWLARKAEIGGFSIRQEDVRVADMGFVRGKTHSDHPTSLYAVQFDGLLQVVDPDLFLHTIQCGIGSGKGMGFGLLSVARPGWGEDDA